MAIVVVIIGIILALILKASQGGILAAEEAATRSLILKLGEGLYERVSLLSEERPLPTYAHVGLARTYMAGPGDMTPGTYVESIQRANVIAQFDYLRANLPDTFVVTTTSPTEDPGVYPINFAAEAFEGSYALPLGAAPNLTFTTMVQGSAYLDGGFDATTGAQLYAIPIRGMYGASFDVAASIYQALGYGPRGYDGIDNNGDGWIDDYLEGVAGLSESEKATISTRLAAHVARDGDPDRTDKTARSEMLYAVLVGAKGPSGTTFDPDDFRPNEVKDTDDDGLPEFVDAWGQPLQFFRWPILYKSDSQRGYPSTEEIGADLASGAPGPYDSVFETREQTPLDPGQLLLAPSWWGASGRAGVNYGPAGFASVGSVSGGAIAFQYYFHSLVEPLAGVSSTPDPVRRWDRSSNANLTARRAFKSQPLILSGGPDKVPGVGMLAVNYRGLEDRSSFPRHDGTYVSARDASGAPVALTATNLIRIENQAGKIAPNRGAWPYLAPIYPGGNYRNDTTSWLEQYGFDDVSNYDPTAGAAVVSQ